MINYMIMAIALSISVIGHAYSQPLKVDSPAESSTLLKLKLAKLQHYRAQFAQVVRDSDGNTVQQASGQLMLQQPRKMRFETTLPDPTMLVSNGQTLWHFDPFLEQVTIYQLDNIVEGNPILFLTEPENPVWQQTEVEGLGDGRFRVTTQGDSQIVNLSLAFNDDQLVQLEVVDSTGQQSTFSFTEISNQALDSDIFEFAIPAGIDVDDQR